MRKPDAAGAAAPIEIVGEQPLNEEDKALMAEAYSRLQNWQRDCAPWHRTAEKCRDVYRLNDPEQDPPNTPPERKAIQLQTLKSTINNCIADQMDNMPDAKMLPETREAEQTAHDMTDVVRFILDQNGYETYHRRKVEDFFIAGTAVTQIGWDKDMDNGHGNVSVMRVPVESMVWDPEAESIQDGRALIKAVWRPLGWIADHYPQQAKYVRDESNQHDGIAMGDRLAQNQSEADGRALVMEYWYRRYENGRYTINMALFAGGALLDKFLHVYAHGMYPFVFDAFTQVPGQPVGESMVYELTPMMRYINRYAQYIDENLRYSCKARMLVREGSEINKSQLADWSQNIVEGNDIGEDSVRWFDTKPLPGMVNNQMLQMQNDMKMDSGQNQFSRGEVSGGVTAASAISALQEAGGKITRMRTAILSAGMKQIVTQVLWLVAQYYTEDRTRLLIGDDEQPHEVRLQARYLMPRGSSAGAFPPPPYSVQIQIQRRNPLRVAAQNDLFLQAYTMSAQSGQSFPLSVLFSLLEVDGRDRIVPQLQKIEQQTQNAMQMQAQMEELQSQNEQLRTSLDAYASSLGGDMSELQEASFGGL